VGHCSEFKEVMRVLLSVAHRLCVCAKPHLLIHSKKVIKSLVAKYHPCFATGIQSAAPHRSLQRPKSSLMWRASFQKYMFLQKLEH